MNIFLLGILLVISGVAIVFLPKQIPIKTAEQKTEPVRTEVPSPRAAYQTDTDGDGVPDWEEKLRGTDPTKPDRQKIAQPEIIARLQEKRTETPRVSLSLSAPPSALVIQNQTVTAPEASSAETVALRAFGNALGGALAPIANQKFEQETLARFNAIIAKKEKLSALASVAAAYTAVSAALKETAAPAAGAALLAKLSASYESLTDAIALLARETTSDPKEISKAWLGYSDAALQVGRALNETIGFFATRHIQFSPTEPGALFNTH